MKVYLDNCCYNRPYDDQDSLRISLETQAKLKIQSLIKDKQIELVSSYMLQYENSHNPYEMRRKATENFVRAHVTTHIGGEDREKVEKIAEPIVDTGVKERDAIHVAAAIVAGCDYFISTDDRLLKYESDSITLVNPMEFIRLEVENDNA